MNGARRDDEWLGENPLGKENTDYRVSQLPDYGATGTGEPVGEPVHRGTPKWVFTVELGQNFTAYDLVCRLFLHFLSFSPSRIGPSGPSGSFSGFLARPGRPGHQPSARLTVHESQSHGVKLACLSPGPWLLGSCTDGNDHAYWGGAQPSEGAQ